LKVSLTDIALFIFPLITAHIDERFLQPVTG